MPVLGTSGVTRQSRRIGSSPRNRSTETGAAVFGSGRTRKELAGHDPHQPAAAGLEKGIYTPGWTARTYAELLRRAERLLGSGESVILDASWRESEHRALAGLVATGTSAEIHQLRCDLSPAAAAQRMRERRGISDADEHIAAVIRGLETPVAGQRRHRHRSGSDRCR